MYDVKVDLTELTRAIDNYPVFEKELPRTVLFRIGREIGKELKKIVEKEVARWKPKNRPKITFRVKVTRQGLTVTVSVDGEVYVFVSFPTKPHKIRPSSANVLVFEVGGKTIFTREVSHPGTRGKNLHKKALREIEQKLADIANKAIHIEAKKMMSLLGK